MRISPNPDYPDPALRLERIGTPYAPARLEELGHLPDVETCPASFDPHAAWHGSFRIFGGHGFVGVRNWVVGCLAIDTLPADGTWRVSVEQHVAYAGGIVHTLTAEAVCNDAPLLPLVEWKVSSRVSRTDGSPQPDLDLDMNFSTADGVVTRTTNGRRGEAGRASPLAGDWPLFAAVQRLPFEAAEYPGFSFADGLSAIKPEHTLRFDEARVARLSGSGLELRCFTQIGPGVLPYDYWLDESHRLIAVISGNRTYLLDDEAGLLFDSCVQSLRRGDGYVSG